jgi:hypothetical protein
MEVKEAIRFLRDDVLTISIISIINSNTAEFNNKINGVADLLESIEAENKAYKEIFELLKRGMVTEDADHWLKVLYGLEKKYLGGK